jgi:hypothetical protein
LTTLVPPNAKSEFPHHRNKVVLDRQGEMTQERHSARDCGLIVLEQNFLAWLPWQADMACWRVDIHDYDLLKVEEPASKPVDTEQGCERLGYGGTASLSI